MTDYEFELPQDIHNNLSLVENESELGFKVVSIGPEHSSTTLTVNGNGAGLVLGAAILAANVCISIAAKLDMDPTDVLATILSFTSEIVDFNTEEVTEDGVCGQTT